MKKLFRAAVATGAVAWMLALAGCPSPAGSETGPAQEDPVDKAALTAAITTANTAKSGVTEATDGSAIDPAAYWATPAAFAAFNTAIAAAETVSQNAAATQTQADAAVTALTQATTTFNAAKSAGTKPLPPGTKTVALIFDEGGNLVDGAAENLSIDRSEGQTLTVTAAEGLTDVQWSLNGVNFSGQRGTASSITIAAVNYPADSYRLTLAAKKNGAGYSAFITFTVTE
jgi:hypothetical protein